MFPSIDGCFLDQAVERPTLSGLEFGPRLGTQAHKMFAAGMEVLLDRGHNALKETHIINVGRGGKGVAAEVMSGRCPCILHAKPLMKWITNRGRMLKLNEALRLQGMSPEKMKKPGNVSERQFAMQVGNAMSVNVVERILTRLLPAAGLTGPLEDRWASGAARRELALTRE